MRFDLVIIGDTPDAWTAAERATRSGLRTAVLRPDFDRSTANGAVAGLLSLRPSSPSESVTMEALCRRAIRSHEFRIARAGKEQGIRSWQGNVRLAGPHAVEAVVDGVTISFDASRILIAVGTTARRPSGAALDRRVLVPEDLARLRSAPRTAVVLGGNRVALGSARLLTSAGTDVTMLDDPTSPSFEPTATSGLRTVAGDVVSFRFDDERNLSEVCLAAGPSLSTDALVFAARRPAATASIRLEAAGLEADEDGRLWCDDLGRTWTPSIVATGEAVGFPRNLRVELVVDALVASLRDDARAGHARLATVA